MRSHGVGDNAHALRHSRANQADSCAKLLASPPTRHPRQPRKVCGSITAGITWDSWLLKQTRSARLCTCGWPHRSDPIYLRTHRRRSERIAILFNCFIHARERGLWPTGSRRGGALLWVNGMLTCTSVSTSSGICDAFQS